ncbi:MAG: hypothetical protein SPF00_03720 [Candidatus Egerieousia sp.]|nr:hypothetical protein [Candidatus Egerieousia sp.]
MSTWIILLIFFLFSLLLRWKSAAVAENKEEDLLEEDLLEEDTLERDVEEIQAEKSLAEEIFAEMRKPAPKPATQPALKPQPAPQYATQPAPQSKSKNQSEEGSLLEEIKKNPKNLILYSEIMRPKFKEF